MNAETLQGVAPLLERCESALAAALLGLQAQSGGVSVCQIHKDGRVTGGLKYEEGRVAARSELRRRLRAASALEWPRLLTEARQAADELLKAQQSAGRPLPWIAYAQGQVDALAALY